MVTYISDSDRKHPSDKEHLSRRPRRRSSGSSSRQLTLKRRRLDGDSASAGVSSTDNPFGIGSWQC